MQGWQASHGQEPRFSLPKLTHAFPLQAETERRTELTFSVTLLMYVMQHSSQARKKPAMQISKAKSPNTKIKP